MLVNVWIKTGKIIINQLVSNIFKSVFCLSTSTARLTGKNGKSSKIVPGKMRAYVFYPGDKETQRGYYENSAG